MHNEKNIPNLSQEFIRKTKRRQSPKHKNQNLCHNKGQQKQNINAKQKEQFDFNQSPSLKNDSDIVTDLKNQLSQLKQSMTNFVHTKIESVRTSNNTNQSKVTNHSFKEKNDKNKQLTMNSSRIESNKTDEKELSKQKEMKKVKSKEKLKFSKVRKVDKCSPLSSANKNESQSNRKVTQDQQSATDQEGKRNKSGDESTLEQDVMRISQFHRKNFEQKMNTLVFNQLKKCSNNEIGRQRSISEAFIAGLSKGGKEKEVVSPQIGVGKEQQKMINSMKQKSEQKNEMQTMKTLLNEKSQDIEQFILNLQDSNTKISQLKTVKNRQQFQLTALKNELAQTVQNSQDLQNQTKRLKQAFIKLQQNNKKLKQQLQTVLDKLKNKELEIIELQKIIQNHNLNVQKIKDQQLRVIQLLKIQIAMNQNNFQEEISKTNQVINQLKIKQSPKMMSSCLSGSTTIIKAKQDPNFAFSTPNSPRFANRQKQLLNVIKNHEKSLQNYQKDLIFLQSECKNLHYFKMVSKKLQAVIKQTNQQLINQQLTKLNSKYEKKHLSFSPNKKEIVRKGIKQKSQEN